MLFHPLPLMRAHTNMRTREQGEMSLRPPPSYACTCVCRREGRGERGREGGVLSLTRACQRRRGCWKKGVLDNEMISLLNIDQNIKCSGIH